jgi:Lrp/AsnC family transcriptional regulator, leucine-responsive regulatory protein
MPAARKNTPIADPLDQHIINELLKNARLPIVTLARRVGLSRTATQSRIDRLERDGFILGYSVRLGDGNARSDIATLVTVDVKVRNQAGTFLARVKRIPEVIACYSVSGEHHFIALVESPKLRDLGRVIEDIYEIPDVLKTVTTHVLAVEHKRSM